VHQEGAVDAHRVTVAPIDVVGVGVSAEADVSFKERDPVACRQHIGGDQAGHAAADDGDRASVGVCAFHIGVFGAGRPTDG
jgi:hypothetical protein